jgi:hypothetical protein
MQNDIGKLGARLARAQQQAGLYPRAAGADFVPGKTVAKNGRALQAQLARERRRARWLTER